MSETYNTQPQPISRLKDTLDKHLDQTRTILESAYREGFEEGRRVERLLPRWNDPIYAPQEGRRIIVCLDDYSMECYVFHKGNRELKNLFDRHVVAWMHAPEPPRLLDF